MELSNIDKTILDAIHQAYSKPEVKDVITEPEINVAQDSLIGMRFGKLTVVSKIDGGKYLCKCDCGKTSTPKRNNLMSGNTKSCGCAKYDRFRTAR